MLKEKEKVETRQVLSELNDLYSKLKLNQLQSVKANPQELLSLRRRIQELLISCLGATHTV